MRLCYVVKLFYKNYKNNFSERQRGTEKEKPDEGKKGTCQGKYGPWWWHGGQRACPLTEQFTLALRTKAESRHGGGSTAL